MSKSQIIKSAEEMQKFAAEFAQQILRQKQALQRGSGQGAVVLALSGELGAGKTTFLQGFAEGLGIKEVVNSPTFVILKRFNNFYHIDCYRLETPEEILELGFEEIIANPKNIVAIEWPEKIGNLLPQNVIKITFKHTSESVREISVL